MRKIKIWKLKGRETRDLFEERLKEKIASSGDGEWKNLEEDILSAGGEICGRTSLKRGRERETWWWNDVVQQRLKEKKVAYKRWQRTGTEVDRETYKDRKWVARREIAIAKRRAFEEWSKNLNTALRSVMLYGGRCGHLLQDWRVYCLVVIEECLGIWLESRGGIVWGVRRLQGGVGWGSWVMCWEWEGWGGSGIWWEESRRKSWERLGMLWRRGGASCRSKLAGGLDLHETIFISAQDCWMVVTKIL